MNLNEINKVHCIGVGGLGVSAIARMMVFSGKKVSGSDTSESKVTKELEDLGIEICFGHKEENLHKDVDLVIHTPAVMSDNPELKKAKSLGLDILSYPEALGQITSDYDLIAVSGTDGKTTTTAMLADVLINMNFDPTVVVGSLLSQNRGNFIKGNSEIFLAEACEYRRHFLNLNPKYLIITNIEEDHLDYFEGLSDIQEAFVELVKKIPENGALICNLKDPHLKLVVENARCRVLDYSEIEISKKLKVPGSHNKDNAKAALALVSLLGGDTKQALEILSEFEGTYRRFQYKGKTSNGSEVYDDFAHNPKEVFVSTKGAKEHFPDKKITVVFQPHLYSRTKKLLDKFSKSFEYADDIIVTDIYAAREKEDSSINGEILAKEIKVNMGDRVNFISDFSEIEKYLLENKGAEDLIITMGAGDVFKIGENIT